MGVKEGVVWGRIVFGDPQLMPSPKSSSCSGRAKS